MNTKIQKFICTNFIVANTFTVHMKKEGHEKVDLQANWPQFLKS